VKVEVLHCSWSVPAIAVVAVALLVKTNSSMLEQEPLVMVQRKVTLLPVERPVTVLIAEAGVVMTAPLADPTTLQRPLPVVGAFPARVKLAELHSS
jgi:hypothetical protein